MPPRYAYWTILVDDQPTAFRAAMQEDLLPTFKRLKHKHPTAVMKWFQNGKLWESRIDAQEAMHARGERGRAGDARQGGFRNRDRSSEWKPKSTFQKSEAEGREPRRSAQREGGPQWKPKGTFQKSEAEGRGPRRSAPREGGEGRRDGGLEWKPKGEFTPAPRRSAPREGGRDGGPKGSFDRESKPEWKSKGSFDRGRKPDWKPKGSFDRDRKPEWKPKGSFDRRPSRPQGPKTSGPPGKLDWKPKGHFQKSEAEGRGPRRNAEREGGPRAASPRPSKREGAWIPKADYKKSQGLEAKRDKNWRPGGEHKDPRQKYKDAKKAKWSRFKTTIRSRRESKPGKKKS